MFTVNILNALMTLLKYSWLETVAKYTDSIALLYVSTFKLLEGGLQKFQNIFLLR